MSASQPRFHERALDAALEAAWLDHPCSPITSAAVAENYLSTQPASSTYDRAFAHLLAASSSVRVANVGVARAHLGQVPAALSLAAPQSPPRHEPTHRPFLPLVPAVLASLPRVALRLHPE